MGVERLKGVSPDLEPSVMLGLTFSRLSSRAMFCNDLKEKYEKRIIIKGVDAETMHTLLDYTYTSKALITKQNVQRVLEAANLFQVCEQIGSSSPLQQGKAGFPRDLPGLAPRSMPGTHTHTQLAGPVLT